jgi:hypothetical protein
MHEPPPSFKRRLWSTASGQALSKAAVRKPPARLSTARSAEIFVDHGLEMLAHRPFVESVDLRRLGGSAGAKSSCHSPAVEVAAPRSTRPSLAAPWRSSACGAEGVRA